MGIRPNHCCPGTAGFPEIRLQKWLLWAILYGIDPENEHQVAIGDPYPPVGQTIEAMGLMKDELLRIATAFFHSAFAHAAAIKDLLINIVTMPTHRIFKSLALLFL